MPLGNAQAFRDWVARDNPSLSRARLVKDWIAEAADRPQAAPGTPIDEMSNQPAYEVRWAKVPGTDVEVFYRHTYK